MIANSLLTIFAMGALLGCDGISSRHTPDDPLLFADHSTLGIGDGGHGGVWGDQGLMLEPCSHAGIEICVLGAFDLVIPDVLTVSSWEIGGVLHQVTPGGDIDRESGCADSYFTLSVRSEGDLHYFEFDRETGLTRALTIEGLERSPTLVLDSRNFVGERFVGAGFCQ